MTTLAELEQLRKNAKGLLLLNLAIVALGTIFWPSPLAITLCVLGVILFLAVVKKKIGQYNAAFKNNIVRASLGGVFAQLCYESKQGVGIEEVDGSQLVELKDEFASNDLIVAKYGKVKFKQADIAISEKSNVVGKNGIASETTNTCFTGRFLVFDFLKPTTMPVKVMGKNFNPEGYRQNAIGSLKNRFVNAKSGQRVFMESEMFNEKFDVFCADAQTAFYILTPQIIEAITMLSAQYEGKIALCFRSEKMYVAIASKKDSLEAKLLSNHTVWRERELVLKDIKVITDFIELMSLESNTLVAASN